MARQRPGFTLIEIIVTLAVMVIILSIAARSFNRTNSQSNLTLAAEALSSDLRAVAMSALNNEQFQLHDPVGWGIYFDPDNRMYTIFADLDGDDDYDTNEKFRSVTLGKNIAIGALYFDSAGWAFGAVTFRSTTVTPYFSGSEVTADTGDFEVQLLDNISTTLKSVFVNPLGAVSL